MSYQVIFSYLVQLFIVILGSYTTCLTWLCSDERHSQSLHAVEKQSTGTYVRRRGKDRLLRAAKHLLASFHVAQILFIITIQAASLISLYKSDFVPAATWQQLWVDLHLFTTIACSGIHPVMCNYYLLRKYYLSRGRPLKQLHGALFGTVCSVSFSMVLFISVRMVQPGPDLIKPERTGPVACGRITPTLYCLHVVRKDPTDFLRVIPPLFVVIFWVAEQIVAWCKGNDQLTGRAGRRGFVAMILNSSEQCNRLAQHRFSVFARSSLSLSLYLILVSCASYNIVDFVSHGSSGWQAGWNMEQTIAATVWAPVLFEFFYYLVRKFITTSISSTLTDSAADGKRSAKHYHSAEDIDVEYDTQNCSANGPETGPRTILLHRLPPVEPLEDNAGHDTGSSVSGSVQCIGSSLVQHELQHWANASDAEPSAMSKANRGQVEAHAMMVLEMRGHHRRSTT
ncbi:hypothetical protein K461DRAFT_43296 [Myriangium duriaei CBS 260.36]|uniref:Uncharacterized protein n=1 Tax=Myriangium duriaei CBS 260.36 TaxID=1168546 RepID=A0A9P4IVI9_9PEZI|nr:hypothetical protein K461DRAFT_43296 [Myriangium duriaei CBS 260.36]